MGKEKFGIYQLEEFKWCFCKVFCGHGPCGKENCKMAELDVDKARKTKINRFFRVPVEAEEKPQKKHKGSSWARLTE